MIERKLTIANEVAELTKLPVFIEELGEILGLDGSKVFQLNLALEEAMTNVVLYAYPESEKHLIDLTAQADDQRVVFILEDTGKLFDPTQVADADITLSAEERQIGGLGIFLIRQIMSKVEYQRVDNKNRLVMTLSLS